MEDKTNAVCVICGKPLPARRWRYCSESCLKEASRKLSRESRPNKERPYPQWITEHTCLDCGKVFVGGIKSKRCRDCQAERDRQSNLAHKQRAKAGLTRKLGSAATCETCGAEYIVNSGRQRYCPACAEASTKQSISAHKKEWNYEHHASTVEKREAYNAGKRRIKSVVHTCPVCGTQFDAPTGRKYCSDACRKSALKAYYKNYDKMRAEKRRAAATEKGEN